MTLERMIPMKKLLCTLLVCGMLLSAFLTSCGAPSNASAPAETTEEAVTESAEPAQTTEEIQKTTEEKPQSVFPEALSSLSALPVPELAATGWTFAGGMIKGVEMEQEDADDFLALCGGTFQFIFPDAASVQMINGETVFDGTLELKPEAPGIYCVFEGYSYYGVFTASGDQTVLILANPKDPTSAFYMTPIDEH